MDERAHMRQATVAKLHAELDELEAEANAVRQRVEALRSEYRAVEERAMAAIRAGDDRSARADLVELQERSQVLAPLEADLTVLRAMTGEYRRALETFEAGFNSTELTR